MVFSILVFSCKEETKTPIPDTEEDIIEVVEEKKDSIVEIVEPIKKNSKGNKSGINSQRL